MLLLSTLQRKSIQSCNIDIIFNLQRLIVNNLRQLKEKHCTSIIPLIKQDALKRNNNIKVIITSQMRKFQITKIGIGIKNFCWNWHGNLKKVGKFNFCKQAVLSLLIFCLKTY